MERRRFELDPLRSRVSIAGTSSIHPINATASGLEGWVELGLGGRGSADVQDVVGEVRIAVDQLRSGNAMVDRETRRRIDARRFPMIVGRTIGARRTGPTRFALDGEIDFRGSTVVVAGELEVVRDAAAGHGAEVHLSGEQSFDVRDWGLVPPRVGFLKVHPHVSVEIDVVAVAH